MIHLRYSCSSFITSCRHAPRWTSRQKNELRKHFEKTENDPSSVDDPYIYKSAFRNSENVLFRLHADLRIFAYSEYLDEMGKKGGHHQSTADVPSALSEDIMNTLHSSNPIRSTPVEIKKRGLNTPDDKKSLKVTNQLIQMDRRAVTHSIQIT